MRTISDLLEELEIDDTTTFDELIEKLSLVTVTEKNGIKTISVKPLPNVVKDRSEELKNRFVDTTIDDEKGMVAILNKRIAILKAIIMYLGNTKADLTNYEQDLIAAQIKVAMSSSDSAAKATLTPFTLEFKNTSFEITSEDTGSTVLIDDEIKLKSYFLDAWKDLSLQEDGFKLFDSNYNGYLEPLLSITVNGITYKGVEIPTLGYINLSQAGNENITTAQLTEAMKKYCVLVDREGYIYYKNWYNDSDDEIYFRCEPLIETTNGVVSAVVREVVIVTIDRSYEVKNKYIENYTKNKTDELLNTRVSKTQKVNGYALSGDVTLDKSDVGLGNVDNTSDADKPISNAAQSALDQRIRYTEVVDNLSNTSTNKPLSANQGKQLKAMIDAINILLASDNVDLDTIQEIVNYIENNKDLIDGITVTKINYTDIVDNLTSAIADKPLSAKQGYILKGLIDALNDAETGIQANEAVRILNESTRQSNEAARVSAEEARQTGYSGFDTRITANANAISGIKDGTNIDSFADVESALSTKANTSDVYAKSEVYTKAETEALQSATLDASKSYTDKVADDLRWELGTYDLGVDTDNSVARVKTLHANTIKSMVDYIGGKTVKYNQLIRNSNFESTSNWSADSATFSVASNEITFIATAQYGLVKTSVNLIKGHKYLYCVDIKCDTTDICFSLSGVGVIQSTSSTNYQTLSGIIDWSATTGSWDFRASDRRASGWTSISLKKAICIDLTLNYGAGNEPSDVATAISLLKANGYKLDGTDTYSTGELKHAIVSEVKYESKNLFDYGTINDYYKFGTNFDFDNHVQFTIGSGAANYCIKYTQFEKGTYTFSYTYTSAPNATPRILLRFYDINNNIITNASLSGWTYNIYYQAYYSNNISATYTFTTPSNVAYFNVGFGGADAVNNLITYENVILVKGTTTPSTYIPYVAPITKAIPSQVLADNRYGLGFDNTNYNHLDIDGHLRGNWGIVDLGTLTWQYSSSWRCFYTLGFTQAKRDSSSNQKNGKNYVGVAGHSSSDSFGDNTISINSSYHDDGYITIRDTSFNGNAQDFKTAMSGVYLLYELAEAFDQDYSQYFTADWNKVDLDKQYATCEMVVDDPIDMPNSITNLFEEVKA